MIVLLIILLLALMTAYICFRMVLRVSRAMTKDPFRFPIGPQYDALETQMRTLVESACAIPCQDVYTASHDGLKLHAKYYESAPDAPIQILFHGYQSNAIRDFSGGLQLALKSGYNVLLVDQRAHGESQGNCLSFGILERQDCLQWIQYAADRFGSERTIVLVGISMGAATVMMASELTLPENVRGIIADCGYTAPEDIIRKVMRDRHYPDRILYPFVRLGGLLFGKFDLNAARADTALKHCRIPVLFIHGEDDRFVPCSMSRENIAACASRKKILTVPNAGHGLSYLIDYGAYESAVTDFLSTI